ncbi:MAG: histidine phosphatase family protein [Muribaculaceae bacterium]|nr:histidine phosphatase family protein [Muribaculaceae bacterium]
MKLYIVRHGETEENLLKILQGHMPGTLTAKGLEQARAAATRLADAGVAFTRIVSSDLKRTMDTAAIISENTGLPVEPMEILRERDWGESTGMPIAEARERFYCDGKWQFPPSAESEDDIYRRAGRALEQLRQLCGANETVIVVTHGQLARNLIAARFGCPVREVTQLINGEVRVLAL